VAHVLVGPGQVQLEGHGVVPDVRVPLSPKDVMLGRDSQLEAALSILRRIP
jgi:C-terminal processing protease CtpA/Prc